MIGDGPGRGAAHFHGSGGNSSLRKSTGVHVRLPVLLAPELRQRGLGRGTGSVALLILWEAANLAGVLAEWAHRPAELPVAPKADRREGVR